MPLDQGGTIAKLEQIAGILRESAEMIARFKANHPDAYHLGYEPGQEGTLERMAGRYLTHALVLRTFAEEIKPNDAG